MAHRPRVVGDAGQRRLGGEAAGDPRGWAAGAVGGLGRCGNLQWGAVLICGRLTTISQHDGPETRPNRVIHTRERPLRALSATICARSSAQIAGEVVEINNETGRAGGVTLPHPAAVRWAHRAHPSPRRASSSQRLVEPEDAVGVVGGLDACRGARGCRRGRRAASRRARGPGSSGYTRPEPHGWTSSHERASQSRALRRCSAVAPASTTTSCLSRKRSPRCAKAVASSADAVVRPAPRREVEHAHFSRRAAGGEMVEQRLDRVARQRAPEELRLDEAVGARHLVAGPVLGEPALGLPVGQLLEVGRRRLGERFRATPSPRPRYRAWRRTRARFGGAAGSGPAVTSRLAASSSGASGAHACQASATAAASSYGHCRCSVVVVGAGTVRSVSSVTTPNWQPPAPRKAQNSSA